MSPDTIYRNPELRKYLTPEQLEAVLAPHRTGRPSGRAVIYGDERHRKERDRKRLAYRKKRGAAGSVGDNQ